MCNETNIGEFIVSSDASEKSKSLIISRAVNLKDPSPINYSIKKTGYYCVVTDPYTAGDYKAVVEFRNAYGELAATQIPKLPFYGGITILYALMSAYWAFLYYQHRHDILPVQNYITAILVFLVVEMLMTWAFFGKFPEQKEDNETINILSAVLLTGLFRCRLSEPKWIKCWLQGDAHSGGHTQRRAELFLILLTPYCLHGLRCCQAYSG